MNRRGVARDALDLLRHHAHGAVCLPNDPLVRVAPHLPIMKAFDVMSRLAAQPIQDLLRVLTRMDLSTLKTVLRNATDWQLGIGEGTRDHPELAAVDAAFRSPWISKRTDDAREVLVLIAAPDADERTANAVIRDIDLRCPRASVTWGMFSEPGILRVSALVGF